MNQLTDNRHTAIQPWVVVEPPAIRQPQPPIVVHEHHNSALPHVAIVGIVAVAVVAIVALFLSADFGTLALGAMLATIAWWGAWGVWTLTRGRA